MAPLAGRRRLTPRRWALVAAVAAAVVLVVGRAAAAVYVDYAWYDGMGAAALWATKAWTTLLLRGGSAAAAITFVFANLYAVRQSIVSLVLPRRVANLEIGEEVPGRYLLGVVGAVSVLLGAVLTLPGDSWPQVALAMAGAPFGDSDPYFQLDFGFFVYWLPVETVLYTWALVATLTVTAVVVVLYGLTPSLRWERGTLTVSTYVRRHLSVLAALLLVVLAWSYRLDAYNVLGAGSGPGGAFAYADHHVGIPSNLILSLISISAAVVVFWAGWTGQVRVAFAAVTAVLLLSVVVHQLAPTLARRLADTSDPTVRERPYQATRAAYTQRAYGADLVAAAPEPLGITSASALEQSASVWDEPALARAARRGDGAPGPAAAAIGWAVSDAGLVAVVAQRPLEHGTGDASGWTVARLLAGQTDERGGVLRVDAAGAPATDDAALVAPVVTDSAPAYAVVADSAARVAGARLEGDGPRLAHAWTLQNFRLLFGDLPRPRPTIILHADARERVARLAPVFAQGSTLTPIVDADTLYWVIELASTSASFPLSLRLTVAGEERSYFRHAATALVNSATGRVVLIADPAADSLAVSWLRRFPALVTTASRLPPRLVAALPADADELRARAAAYGAYGSGGAAPPPRHLPWVDGADSAMAHGGIVPFLLPAGGRDRLAAAVPLLDETERLLGLVAVTGGPTRVMMWMPLRPGAPRWPVVLEELRLPVDSATASGSRRDGAVARGPVRVLPVAGRPVFIQSSYLSRNGGGLVLTRVAAAVGDTVRSARTLADAVGAAHAAPRLPPGGAASDVRGRAAALYEAMRAALRRGDWTAFGQAFERLGALVGGRAP